MSLVTVADRMHFEKYGYVVIEDAVPPDKCEAVVDDVWNFTGKDRNDRDTWYEPPEGLDEHFQSVGAMEMYFAPSMWDTRQDPGLYQAFAELLGYENLWVSIDRVNFTPPSDPEHPEIDRALPLHWDMDASTIPEKEIQRAGTSHVPYGVQGVLHLRDTSVDQGGFRCVPEVYQDLYEGFLEEHNEGWEDGDVDIGDREIVDVGGGQGDILIWNRLLLHANGRNTTDEPRFAQYITMFPERFNERDARRNRIRTWREREAIATPGDGDPRGYEKEQHPPADLTPLGRKLLGADPWSGWLDFA